MRAMITTSRLRNSVIIYRKEFSNRIEAGCLQYSSEHRDRTPKSKTTGFMSKPRLEEIDRDYIGPPDKLSNLRPILRHEAKDETPLEQELRLKRVEVEEWNQRFWQNHNQKFIKEKEAFILANKVDDSDTLSADKMSEFYKNFLDENWQTHFNYNKAWYKHNFDMLILAYRTKFQLSRLFGRKKAN